MIPNKKQWRNWSLPSKYSALGLLLSVIGILFTLYQLTAPDGNKELTTEIIKAEIKGVYEDIVKKNDVKSAYSARYYKQPIAVISNTEVISSGSSVIVRLYYDSYWEGLTSTFLAAIQVRRIEDLNKNYADDEGWEVATLLDNENVEDRSIYLGSSKYVIISSLLKGVIYEARIIDYNYDSDEPPSLPHRFKIVDSK